MFIKLLKYNLKPIFKSLLPFAILVFASVLLFNITGYASSDEYATLPSELHQFLHGVANFMIACSLILFFASAARAIWHQFKVSFYSDEAYLTHTLPLPRHTLWNAQICSILITFATMILFLIPNSLILALTRDGQQLLESLGLIGGCTHCLGAYFSVKPHEFSFYLSYALVVFTEFVFLTICGISGIVISKRLGKNLSIIIGAAIYLIGTVLQFGTLVLIREFDPKVLSLFQGIPVMTPGLEVDFSYITRALLYISAGYLCYSTALYIIDRKLLHQGINLD